MTTLDFNQIRRELLEKGLISVEAMEMATKEAISITGQFDGCGGIDIKSVSAGIFGNGVFFKGIRVKIDLPEIEQSNDDEAESKFKADLKKMYPDYTILLKID